MKNRIHFFSGFIATFMIASFFFSTIFVELFCSKLAIAAVKSLIVVPGLLILIPAIATAGGTGFYLSRSRKGQLVEKKKKRMPVIGLIGILVLIPAAILLDKWASNYSFGTIFYILQSIEIIAGGINLTMMSLNIHDGLRLSGRLHSQKPN